MSYDPPPLRGMLTLDRDAFKRDVPLTAVRVGVRDIAAFRKAAGSDVVRLTGVAPVVDLPRIRNGSAGDGAADKAVLLQTIGTNTAEYIAKHSLVTESYTHTLHYDDFSTDQVLGAILPAELADGSPAGFTMVGHIAHLNLREDYLPYKSLVGQVILDKNRRGGIRTVVNKLQTIDTRFRTFAMEVLAGEPDFAVAQHEQGSVFRFDFREVYWNSRLHTEHERLVGLFQPGQAIADVMAGVGPFAIPAAKKGCLVYANDLNPASFASLRDNVVANKVQHLCEPSELDGAQFIATCTADLQARGQEPIVVSSKRRGRRRPGDAASATATEAIDGGGGGSHGGGVEVKTMPTPTHFSHYVLNLPASAISFLGAFRGAIPDGAPMPNVHVYAFTCFEGHEAERDLLARISASLAHKVTRQDVDFHVVRKVAPAKTMYCCSFTLPAAVGSASQASASASGSASASASASVSASLATHLATPSAVE